MFLPGFKKLMAVIEKLNKALLDENVESSDVGFHTRLNHNLANLICLSEASMESDHYHRLFSERLDTNLEELRDHVLSMGALVVQQLQLALKALFEADVEAASEVMATEQAVNEMEWVIDEECTQMIARHQANVSDLRMIYTLIKINTNLERTGDAVCRMARLAMVLSQSRQEILHQEHLQSVGYHALETLTAVLKAFQALDASQALKAIKAIEEGKSNFEAAHAAFLETASQDLPQIRRCMNLMWYVRSIEQVEVHSRNMAEQILYCVKGIDVRGEALEQQEWDVAG